MEHLKGSDTFSRKDRATRFPIRLTLRFRNSAESEWYEGTTENISRSGVLFRAHHAVQLNAPLDIKLTLPPAILKAEPAEVVCRGIVARIGASSDPVRVLLLGTRFVNYKLIRK